MDSSNYPDQSIDWVLPHDSMSADEVLSSLPREAIFHCEIMECVAVKSFIVRIYAVSPCGYWEFCESTAIIRNDDDVCPTNCAIQFSGNITNCMGEYVDNVLVELTGGLNNQVSRHQYVNGDGEYRFLASLGSDWCVTANKEDAYLNGVSAQDLSLLLRHISGIELLVNPYKKVACDLNGDHQIDVRDMLLLRKLLLGIINDLDDVESWVFIDAAFDFPGITDYSIPNYPTQICRVHVVQHEFDADFVAVKTGDLDGGAGTNLNGDIQTRSNAKPLQLYTMDKTVKAGEVIELSFTSDNFSDMMAFQGTLAFDQDALEFVDFQSAGLEVMINNQRKNRGQIPFLWASATAITLESIETLFILKIRAKKSGQLKDFIGFSSAFTEATAFSETGQEHDLALEFVDEVISEFNFELFQNSPNPVNEQTTVRFSLPTPQAYQIAFYNVQGRYLSSIQGQGIKGLNEIQANCNEFSSSSELIYYQLVTDNFIATSTMNIH